MESRNEAILQGIIDGTDSSEFPAPQSRVEALLLQVLDKINQGGGGGGGGTSDYTQLSNKPSINSVTLTGNKSLSDLGIASTWVGTAVEYAALAPDYDPDTLYFIRE